MSRLALAALMLLAAVDARSQSPAKPAAPAAKPAAPAASARPVDDRVVQVCEIRYQDVQSVSLVLPSLMSDAGVLTVDRATRTVTVVDRPEFVQRSQPPEWQPVSLCDSQRPLEPASRSFQIVRAVPTAQQDQRLAADGLGRRP